MRRTARSSVRSLECFVHAEIAKAAALSDETTTITHYRDKDQVEVDLVLERSPDRVVGIEIKASATARPKDFRGLERLSNAAGDGFACGIVLHDGERVQQTGPRLYAMPMKMLWTALGRGVGAGRCIRTMIRACRNPDDALPSRQFPAATGPVSIGSSGSRAHSPIDASYRVRSS